jgi:hypothetical protein
MTEAESPALLRARHFSALCDLDEAGRAAGLAALAAHDAALAAEVARMLALDAEERVRSRSCAARWPPPPAGSLLSGEPDDAPPLAPPERLGAWRIGEKLGARRHGRSLGRRDGSRAVSPSARR